MMSTNISQSSFPLLQANSMDRHITSNFQIPAGSFGMFTINALTIWIAIYDRVLLPLASKLRGKPVRLSTKEIMGIGLFFSCMAMVVSGLVEHIGRRRAIHEGFLNNPHGLVGMSAMWLVPQHCLSGLAEAFNAIGQTEFYYSEFPKSMSSIASSLFGLGMAVANLLASVILSTVDNATNRGGKESWVSININRGHYENYYWLLAIISFINLGYFLLCSWAYGPCVEQGTKVEDEGSSP
ncbi:protein NRT1/ PTR FAMILY 1.2-like [Malania oleifera]|uniref:protein NRT1/ PTR FAMILY 1.2-like n=1 Tax=Malania oleifera TaxID=397392 RepID=UPI0025ADD578|nr:protein NRT1/ PTR FAMILY 1.2-like [Malania oleifera]